MRRRILFYFALALVPMTALALYLAVDERNEEEARSRAVATAIVNTAKSDLDGLFRLSHGVVSGLSYEATDADICRSLGVLRRSVPEISSLGVFRLASGDQRPQPVCGTVAPASDPFPATREEMRLTSGLVHPGDLAVGCIRRSVVTGKPVIPIGGLVSLAADGTRRVVGVTVSPETLNKQLSRVPILSHAVLMVLDNHGVIAAQVPASEGGKAGNPASAFERALATRADFVGETAADDGINRFYTTAHAGGKDGMEVVLKIPAADIFQRSRVRLLANLAGLLIIGALVFGIAWMNSEQYVARPLTRLTDVAGRLAKGSLAERSGLGYEGEIGRLARSFDVMAECLQQDQIRDNQMLGAMRALTARLDSVSEEERTRIAREIHDELGQQFTAIRFELARLDRNLANPQLSGKVQDLTAMVDSAIRDIRKIATDLRPVALEFGGLVDAIRVLAEECERRTGMRCRLYVPERVSATGSPANCLFRICQESLTNVARHAEATEVEISLAVDTASLTLTVRDNGRGFVPDTTAHAGSLGLLGMRERARMAGGILSITSAPGAGTTVMAWIRLGDGGEAGDALSAFV